MVVLQRWNFLLMIYSCSARFIGNGFKITLLANFKIVTFGPFEEIISKLVTFLSQEDDKL